MAPLVLTAISLAAKFAPEVIRHLTGSDQSAEVAQTVIDTARAVTGLQDPVEIEAALSANAEAARQFKEKVMEYEKELEAMHLADVQSARERDVKLAQVGIRNTRANWMLFTTVTGIVAAVWVMVNFNLSADTAIGGVLIFLIGKLTGNWEAAFAFEFGTTRSSKEKDTTISKLTGGKGPLQ